MYFFSFVITEDERFLTGDGQFHYGIEVGWDLKPNTYREAEWVDEGPEFLEVCGINQEDEDLFKSIVLNKFNARSELLATITEGRTDEIIYKFKNGKFHCENGPAVEWIDGSKEWWINDKLHRVDGPAVERADGSKYWWINDELHREDGPAIEYANGGKEWYCKNKLHRVGGPAIEYADGGKEWYLNDVLHREDGPAIERTNNSKEWWIKGKFLK
jgi:hypothetical protein